MPKKAEAPRVARRLVDEHDGLVRRFDELCTSASADPARDLVAPWAALVADLHEHFAFEEQMLFPAFAQQSIECGKLVKALVAEHAAARELVTEVGLQIEQHEIRPSTLEVLADLLREHADVENARIYPWSEKGAVSRGAAPSPRAR